jgi:di-heme cytochrome c peroxidase
MQATSFAIRLVLSVSCAMLVAPAVSEDTGVGPPPVLAPGQAPPLPQAGALAEPRSSDQVGFPTALTAYAISPTSLRPARVALGQRLFFEPRLSGDRTVACATCHDPARAFTDGRPVSVGIHGRVGQRNAPTIPNALYNKHQFWDGRVATLEQQAALPITNPFGMGSASSGDAVSRIVGDEDYQTQFMRAFGRPVNDQDMLSAIAAYERTLTSFDSPFVPLSFSPVRNVAQFAMTLRRRWSTVVRERARATAVPILWARHCSATLSSTPCSAAQSRNPPRKPWTAYSPSRSLRTVIVIAMLLSSDRASLPGNT